MRPCKSFKNISNIQSTTKRKKKEFNIVFFIVYIKAKSFPTAAISKKTKSHCSSKKKELINILKEILQFLFFVCKKKKKPLTILVNYEKYIHAE